MIIAVGSKSSFCQSDFCEVSAQWVERRGGGPVAGAKGGTRFLWSERTRCTSAVFATDSTRLLMSRNSFNGDKLSRSHNTSAVVAAIREKIVLKVAGQLSSGDGAALSEIHFCGLPSTDRLIHHH